MSGHGSGSPIAPPGYQYILPTLPSGETVKECLFLNCEAVGRSYPLEDFRNPLQELSVLKDMTGIGPFEMMHQDITLKRHWVLLHVTGEALKKAFDHYDEVKKYDKMIGRWRVSSRPN
ncbi:hypothetical protein HPB50_024167 [Hyalomma asiaticum]|uniref:Uncharacterized protein n=1 Tax=Hyalomma asiaticum TaxID=266040 RepID=A0ACB7SK10_HYAAI|nr:hypothetical protein HPB50_024167 [Hyalomma asiaticum]